MLLIRRFIGYLLALPLAAILIALFVANKNDVRFSLDPFNSQQPSVAYDIPLYLLLVSTLLVGLLAGSAVTWFGQHKVRKALRNTRKDAAHWHDLADREAARADQLAHAAKQINAPTGLENRT